MVAIKIALLFYVDIVDDFHIDSETKVGVIYLMIPSDVELKSLNCSQTYFSGGVMGCRRSNGKFSTLTAKVCLRDKVSYAI